MLIEICDVTNPNLISQNYPLIGRMIFNQLGRDRTDWRRTVISSELNRAASFILSPVSALQSRNEASVASTRIACPKSMNH